MRDDKYLEMEREAYLRRIEKSRTRRELRRRREIRNRVFTLVLALLLLVAVVMTVGVDGHEDEAEIVLERVEMPEIVVGDKPLLTSLGQFRITYYCACEACCCKDKSDPWYGITATGTKATAGRTIAVDPAVIPYGSEVAVFYDDGRICYYRAEDCGSTIKGNEIDVFVDSHEEALELGVMGASVYLVNEVYSDGSKN